MNDVVALVQFLHPGGEHNARRDRDGVKPWNVNVGSTPHERCYLVSPGQWVDGSIAEKIGPNLLSGEVCFWGEWEPEAQRVLSITDPGAHGPRNLYRPLYPSRQTFDLPYHNTDPFVFGDCFRYTNCLQYRNGRPTRLRHLKRGTVILFGSCIEGRFRLDTVFVVAGHTDHDASTYHDMIERDGLPDAFVDATLRPLYERKRCGEGAEGGCTNPAVAVKSCLPPADDVEALLRTYRLYHGATCEEPVNGMFSFFPCLPRGDNGNGGFVRPEIEPVGELSGFIRPGLRRGYPYTVGLGSSRMRAAWIEVVKQVISQKCCLGVRAALPMRADV